MIIHKPEFRGVVQNGWNAPCEGFEMFKIVSRLKRLKGPMRKQVWSNDNLHNRVIHLRKELDEIQKSLDKDP